MINFKSQKCRINRRFGKGPIVLRHGLMRTRHSTGHNLFQGHARMRLQFDPTPAAQLYCCGDSRHIATVRKAICIVAATVLMTGCKSGMPPLPKMPKFGMMGFKREPSPEALAGVGPTTTYPLSPSSGVTPEAIASTAGGTAAPSGIKPQTSNIAGTSAPGAGSAPAGVNNAAAAANGFYGASGRPGSAGTPATFASSTAPTGPTGSTGGFSYGQNPAIAKPMTSPTTSTGGIAAIPAGYAPPKSVAPQASVPAYAQTNAPAPGKPLTATTPAPAPGPSYSSVPGYPLPGAPANASAAANTAPPAFAMPPAASIASGPMPSMSSGGFTMPGNVTPADFAPAPSASSSGPAAYQAVAPSRTSAPTAPSTGYKPGSTSGAVGYPSIGGYPSTGTSDTFYR